MFYEHKFNLIIDTDFFDVGFNPFKYATLFPYGYLKGTITITYKFKAPIKMRYEYEIINLICCY